MKSIGYLAVDQGAKRTLQALAERLPGTWLGDESGARTIELIVCGTSDTLAGRAAESAMRQAFKSRGRPCAVIEDFPGNYYDVPDAPAQLVIVESEFAAQLARAKSGAALPVGVCPGVRYDPLRRRLPDLRSASRASEAAVLWVGQPETGDSLSTLRRILPALAARGMRICLRAHPRDGGYARGAYAGLPVEDVTSLPLEECLARRPRLVITQFSSVAIEAGFWGIPSLNVLFADLGGRTLAAKKGYSVPPWCEAGAAFLISQFPEADKILDRALGSVEARSEVMEAFDGYFKVHEEGAPKLINLLYNQGLL